MPSFTYTRGLQGAGQSLGRSVTRAADHPNTYEVDLPAAIACDNWVKNDPDTGTCDEPSGFVAGTYDVYWVGGKRYGVDATSLGGGSMQLDGGTGDDFPASATSITICKQTEINTVIDGDQIAIIGIELKYPDPSSTSLGHLDMQDDTPATVAAIELAANNMRVWDIVGGDTNGFSGNVIEKTYASHNDVDAAATLKIMSLEDSTP